MFKILLWEDTVTVADLLFWDCFIFGLTFYVAPTLHFNKVINDLNGNSILYQELKMKDFTRVCRIEPQAVGAWLKQTSVKSNFQHVVYTIFFRRPQKKKR
jgi:hypothetical protein